MSKTEGRALLNNLTQDPRVQRKLGHLVDRYLQVEWLGSSLLLSSMLVAVSVVLLASGDLTLLLAWLPESGDRGLELEGGDRGLELEGGGRGPEEEGGDRGLEEEGGDRGRSGDRERAGVDRSGVRGREAGWDGGLSGEHSPDSRD